MLFSFGSFFIGKYLVVKAESEIIIHKFDVNFPDDIIVNEYLVEENDTVRKGDVLFYYRLSHFDDGNNGGGDLRVYNNNSGSDYSKSTENWLIREKIQTEKEINMLKLEIGQNQEEIKQLTAGMERLKKEVFLDIYPPAKLKEAENKVENAKMEISTDKKELVYLRNYLAEINARLGDMKTLKSNMDAEAALAAAAEGNGDGDGFNSMNIPYIAPKGGMVSQIYALPNETSYKSYLVMDMIELKDIHIKAYFKQAALNYVDEGDIVDITFPDGSKSKGVIDKIYLKTTNLPDRLYDTGSDLERRIRAIVIPLKIDDADKWFKFYKINVTVTKSKYF